MAIKSVTPKATPTVNTYIFLSFPLVDFYGSSVNYLTNIKIMYAFKIIDNIVCLP